MSEWVSECAKILKPTLIRPVCQWTFLSSLSARGLIVACLIMKLYRSNNFMRTATTDNRKLYTIYYVHNICFVVVYLCILMCVRPKWANDNLAGFLFYSIFSARRLSFFFLVFCIFCLHFFLFWQKKIASFAKNFTLRNLRGFSLLNKLSCPSFCCLFR